MSEQLGAARGFARPMPGRAPARVASRCAKRGIDVAIACLAILIIAPLVLIIVVAVLSESRGPILYRHVRVGRGGRTFQCLKFRTMYRDAEQRLHTLLEADLCIAAEWAAHRKLGKDPRITVTGRLLRATSLDELPQFLNVLRGEMSLVGPRPVTEEELLRYGICARSYRSVCPGITGVWQVSGRNEVDYAERVRLDDRYAREWSVLSDLVILLRTPAVVITRRGAR